MQNLQDRLFYIKFLYYKSLYQKYQPYVTGTTFYTIYKLNRKKGIVYKEVAHQLDVIKKYLGPDYLPSLYNQVDSQDDKFFYQQLFNRLVEILDNKSLIIIYPNYTNNWNKFSKKKFSPEILIDNDYVNSINEQMSATEEFVKIVNELDQIFKPETL